MNGRSQRTTPPYAAYDSYNAEAGFDGHSHSAGVPTPAASLAPSPVGKRLVDGYRKEIMTEFEADGPRINPMNTAHVQSSALVDLNDPIQVHLLTETALLDSERYEILSQEEVDALKKQCQSLSQRIRHTRANLALQSKYRDAAISMTKLYSPTRPESRRRSLLLKRASGASDASAREAEAERIASERRCEELAAELFDLEKRLMDPKRRLLEHTAAILQLTHHRTIMMASTSARKPPLEVVTSAVDGMPASPESMYATIHDDRFPGSVDDGAREHHVIEIPPRSPIRDQARDLREENDRLRDQNSKLMGQIDQLRHRRGEEPQNTKEPSYPDLEERLSELSSLAYQAVAASVANHKGLLRSLPPAGEPLDAYLGHAERGLELVLMAQGLIGAPSEDCMRRVDTLVGQVGDLFKFVNPERPPPKLRTDNLADQLDEVGEFLRSVTNEVIEAMKGAGPTANADVDSVLRSLFDSIQQSIAEARSRREQARAAGQLDDDMSGDEAMDTEEEYSLQAFASKVAYVTVKASDLGEQKTVLRRQIRQQRELNSRLTADTEADLMRMQDELRQAHAKLEQAQRDAADAQVQLTDTLRDAEAARAVAESTALTDAEVRLAERNAAMGSLEAQSRELQARLGELEPAVQDLRTKLAGADARVASLNGQLSDTVEAKRFVEGELEAKQREMDARQAEFDAKLASAQNNNSGNGAKEKDDEIDRLNAMVVELKTELTFAQAELDGAYGSRAQRAKEAAAVKNSGEVLRLQGQVRDLKTQLAQTVEELEQITKETLGAERDKIELETKLDDAVAASAALEREAADLRRRLDLESDEARLALARVQEELDSERLKALAAATQTAGRRAGAGASMLSEQFRATMREERKKFQEDLKEEQAKRRKVEDQLAKLRRETAAAGGKQ